MKLLRLIPDNTAFDFFRLRFVGYAVSVLVTFGSLGLFLIKGLNYGVDFTGGTVIEIGVPVTPDLPDLRAGLNKLGLGDISIQEFGEPQDLLIRLPQQKGGEEAQKLAVDKTRAYLDERYRAKGAEEPVDYRRTEFVGPQVGAELKKAALIAVILSVIGIVGYVTYRFEWQYGVGVIIALLHDVAGTVGFFAITQMQFDLSTLAALLLVAGYSVNDTVIIFDRIRENLRKFKKMDLPGVINLSVNQTLSRTIMTSGTTLMSLVALWLFGGEVIRGFVSALFLGILLGTYSSIYVASPFLIYLNLRKTKGAADDEGEKTAAQAG